MTRLSHRWAVVLALLVSSPSLAAARGESPRDPAPATSSGVAARVLPQIEAEADRVEVELSRAQPWLARQRVHAAVTRLTALIQGGAVSGGDPRVTAVVARLANLVGQAEHQSDLVERLDDYLAAFRATPVPVNPRDDELWQLSLAVRSVPAAEATATLLRGLAPRADEGAYADLLAEVESARGAFRSAIDVAVAVQSGLVETYLADARKESDPALRSLALASGRQVAASLAHLDPGNRLAAHALGAQDAMVATDGTEFGD